MFRNIFKYRFLVIEYLNASQIFSQACDIVAEFSSRVVSTPASYSEDSEFKSRPGYRLF
jgi:hypothetical protein